MADAAALQVDKPRPRRSRRPRAARPRHVLEDVWTHADPRSRVRAVLLLLVNFILFCGLCVFTHWLHVARLFDFSWESYAAPGRFWTSSSPNLNDFILYPINVTRAPVHGIVLGLTLAAIIATPLVVAILYRLPSAVPFALAVIVFAHMPWMGVTLMLSCIVATVPPFRWRFRFGSALVAMLPVLLYLYLATRGPSDALDEGSPTQRALMAAPWILAILAAAAMTAIVLIISRFMRYRPGAIAPVQAIMFATPVVLFHMRVGSDELAYRTLEVEHGPRSAAFAPLLNARPVIREMIARWSAEQAAFDRFYDDALVAVRGDMVLLKRLILNQMLFDFLADRARAHEACKRFTLDYPTSRYIPEVLYIHARIMDMRLDERDFDLRNPRRELYTDYPHPQSEPFWAALVREHAVSPLAAVAGLRLGQIHLRRGNLDEALATLEIAIPRPVGTRPGVPGSPSPPDEAVEPGLDFDPRPYRGEACRLRELILANRDDPQFGDEPLRALAALDPRREQYAQQLGHLAVVYRESRLYDNLLVRWADAIPGSEQRVSTLKRVLALIGDSDATPEALFRLAELELRSRDPARIADGTRYFRTIAERYPQSCWAAEAAARIRPDGETTAEAVNP